MQRPRLVLSGGAPGWFVCRFCLLDWGKRGGERRRREGEGGDRREREREEK